MASFRLVPAQGGFLENCARKKPWNRSSVISPVISSKSARQESASFTASTSAKPLVVSSEKASQRVSLIERRG